MAALTNDRVTEKKSVTASKSYPVAASTVIYAGGLVVLNSAGYAVPAADAAGMKVVGVATARVDNAAGGNGDARVVVEEGDFRLPAVSITQEMVGQVMYVVDDQTFDDAVGTNAVKAGRLVSFVSATEGWVRVRPAGEGITNADAGATYTAAEQALINKIKDIINKRLLG